MRWSDLHALSAALSLASTLSLPAQDVPPTAPEKSAPTKAKTPADGEKKPDSTAPDANAAAPPGSVVELPGPSLGGVEKMLPVGRSAEKLVIPVLDELGRVASMTKIGKLTRRDETTYFLEDVQTVSYDHGTPDAAGRPATTMVQMTDAVFDRVHQKLESDKPVKIHQPEGSIDGPQGMIYDMTTGLGTVKGRSVTRIPGSAAAATPPPELPDEPPADDAADEPAPTTPETRTPPSQ